MKAGARGSSGKWMIAATAAPADAAVHPDWGGAVCGA